MLRALLVVMAAALASSPCLAQQQGPIEQRVKTQIASQLGELMISNAALSAQVEALTKENEFLRKQAQDASKKE